jgi:2-polyprenyl-3-methyl-5-hydroxy-6-metoxy-1,4-benzoquinol methylase
MPALPLNHWDNPRGSIANKHVDNDFAYVSRGANIALYILKEFNITPSDAKNMTILDYGCGTGRAAAFLALLFGKSVGYDPNVNCIKTAHLENIKSDLSLPNLLLTDDIASVPVCDIAFSTNVIEHLSIDDERVMIENLKIKVNGETLLWYSPSRNLQLQPYLKSSLWSDKINKGLIQIDFFDIH